MKSEVVSVYEILKKLAADVTFRPDDGAFRSKLAEMVIANADGEVAELFSESSSDISVSISRDTIEEGIIRFLVVGDLGELSLECAFTELDDDEHNDLAEQLSRLVAGQTPSVTHDTQKVIVRKNINGTLDVHQAAQKLGCSQTFLKSKIPCTDYSYLEVDGKTEIKEYYWSEILIDRLCNMKLNGAKAEDVQYVAKECCDGDCIWAEEILVSLGSPISKPKSDDAVKRAITKRPAKNISKEQPNNRPPRRRNP